MLFRSMHPQKRQRPSSSSRPAPRSRQQLRVGCSRAAARGARACDHGHGLRNTTLSFQDFRSPTSCAPCRWPKTIPICAFGPGVMKPPRPFDRPPSTSKNTTPSTVARPPRARRAQAQSRQQSPSSRSMARDRAPGRGCEVSSGLRWEVRKSVTALFLDLVASRRNSKGSERAEGYTVQ